MYRVTIHRQASRYLKKLPTPEKENIKESLRKLALDPFQIPNVKHMVGEWKGYHRIRIGNVRVIFWIDQEEKIIYIDHIGPRGDVYK